MYTLALAALPSACTEPQSSSSNTHPVSQTHCDTTAIAYSGEIQSIINKECLLCHQGSKPLGKIHLDSYDSLVHYISSGTLIPAIERRSDLPMPPSYTLPDCEIQKIKSWIAAGHPDH